MLRYKKRALSADFDFVAFEGCSWVAMESTHVLGGRSDAAMTLSRCQSVCVNNVDCTGLDWNPTKPSDSGQRCWLTGPWSGGWRIGVVPDITHYNLTRNAGCGSIYLDVCLFVFCLFTY